MEARNALYWVFVSSGAYICELAHARSFPPPDKYLVLYTDGQRTWAQSGGLTQTKEQYLGGMVSTEEQNRRWNAVFVQES